MIDDLSSFEICHDVVTLDVSVKVPSLIPLNNYCNHLVLTPCKPHSHSVSPISAADAEISDSRLLLSSPRFMTMTDHIEIVVGDQVRHAINALEETRPTSL